MSTTSNGNAISIASLPFKFNPPIHPSLNFVFLSNGVFTTADARSSLEQVYDELSSVYSAKDGTAKFKELRLGRIVMSDESLAFAVREETRYGFRFLYNPTTVSGGVSIGTDIIPDPQNTVVAVLQEGLEVISFELWLDRMPEVIGGASASDYPLSMDPEDMAEIRKRGTHYDLEYLYRCCNGTHNTRTRKKTGDIGILLPNPVELYLGPFRSRGALLSIAVTDIIFSANMVPALSRVNLSFNRYLSADPTGVPRYGKPPVVVQTASVPNSLLDELLKKLAAVGSGDFWSTIGAIGGGVIGNVIGGNSGTSTEGTGGTGVAPVTPGSSGALTGAQVENLARGAGFSAEESKMMTKIAKLESGWRPRAHNPNANTGDNSYGLWQINMIGNLGPSRRKAYGLSSNEALFDPATNARVARGIFKGSGYKAWTTYSKARNSNITW